MSDDIDNEGPFGGFGDDEDEPTQDEIDADDAAAMAQQNASKPEDPPLSEEGQKTAAMLGLTPAEFRARVIQQAASIIVGGDRGQYSREVDSTVQKLTEQATAVYMAEKIQPIFNERMESILFQTTNTWGEPIAGSTRKTFREYLIEKAEGFMTEKVDERGRGEKECKAHGDYYRPSTTRVAFLVHQYLHYTIETAMKNALKTANEAIVGGLETAVKMKLQEIAKTLAVEVKTK